MLFILKVISFSFVYDCVLRFKFVKLLIYVLFISLSLRFFQFFINYRLTKSIVFGFLQEILQLMPFSIFTIQFSVFILKFLSFGLITMSFQLSSFLLLVISFILLKFNFKHDEVKLNS